MKNHEENQIDTTPFDVWNQRKKKIHAQNKGIYFREREVWWCNLGLNIGYEQNGKGSNFSRPVLVIRKFNHAMLWVVPLSIKIKNHPFYITCIGADGTTRSVIYTQLKMISSKRLVNKVTTVDENTFLRIKKAIKDEL